jgi:hypothetical protein
MTTTPHAPAPAAGASRRRRNRTTLWTLVVLAALAALIVWRSLAQVGWECEVWMEYRGQAEHRVAASGTREDALRSAVTSACATLASGMADSMACDRTEPKRVECREL